METIFFHIQMNDAYTQKANFPKTENGLTKKMQTNGESVMLF